MNKNVRKITTTMSLIIIVIMVCLISISISLSICGNAQAEVIVNREAEKRYYSAYQNFSTRAVNQENISYTSYSVLIDSEISVPMYYNDNENNRNACAAVAGSILIGFYDCDYENLIPDYSPAIIRGGKKIFKPATSVTQSVIDDLYVRMKTNTTGDGVTKNECNDGLKAYINSAGYSATISDIASNGQVDVNEIKSNINSGKPMLLFCTMYYFISEIDIDSNVTTLTKYDYQTNHIMNVSGIKQVAYYQDGVNFRTDTYLKVSTGLSLNPSAYILLSSIELDYLETLAIN